MQYQTNYRTDNIALKNMNLPKIHSISKKILVALVGSFLLIFLLFHAVANLFILRHDGGAWYSDFCHFMGSNWIVKAFEVVLLGCILLHIALTLWLALTNRLARPVRYHHPQRSKTHSTSKLMVWTGILIFACLILHFSDFYFVKLGFVKGQYMVKTEKLQSEELNAFAQAALQYGMSPEDFLAANEQQLEMYADQISPEQRAEIDNQMDKFRAMVPVANILSKAQSDGHLSSDGKWIKSITYEEKEALKAALPEADPEPDFYYMTREKFSILHIVIGYLVFFVVLFFHLRHACASAFQTLGLNNYKYNNIIEVLAQIYTWVVCLMFAAVPVLVYLGM